MLSSLRKSKSHRLVEARRKIVALRKNTELQWTGEEIDMLRIGKPAPYVFNMIPLTLPTPLRRL